MPTDKRQRQRENSRARQEAIRAAQKQAARRRQIITTVVAIAAIVGILFLAGLLGGGNDDKASTASASSTTVAPADKGPKCTPRAGRKTEFAAAPEMKIDAAKTYTATFKTDVGTFKVQLDDEKAPKTVNNFVFLANNKYYDCVTFHRVIPGFMIQGGDPEGTGGGGPGYTIDDEFQPEHSFEVGEIAMANTSAPHSGGSQFFVVTGPQGVSLPPQYTPFGKVVDGMDVVKKIEADGNDDPNSNGVPPKVLHKMLTVNITES